VSDAGQRLSSIATIANIRRVGLPSKLEVLRLYNGVQVAQTAAPSQRCKPIGSGIILARHRQHDQLFGLVRRRFERPAPEREPIASCHSAAICGTGSAESDLSRGDATNGAVQCG
jgi:hypothetical protein